MVKIIGQNLCSIIMQRNKNVISLRVKFFFSTFCNWYTQRLKIKQRTIHVDAFSVATLPLSWRTHASILYFGDWKWFKLSIWNWCSLIEAFRARQPYTTRARTQSKKKKTRTKKELLIWKSSNKWPWKSRKMCWNAYYICEKCGNEYKSVNCTKGEKEWCQCCHHLNSPREEVRRLCFVVVHSNGKYSVMARKFQKSV